MKKLALALILLGTAMIASSALATQNPELPACPPEVQ
jgi:hypothetical protein